MAAVEDFLNITTAVAAVVAAVVVAVTALFGLFYFSVAVEETASANLQSALLHLVRLPFGAAVSLYLFLAVESCI